MSTHDPRHIPEGLKEEIIEIIEKVTEIEKDILGRGRSERLFTAKIACALDTLLLSKYKELNLRADPFYNKHGNDPKKLNDRGIEIDIAIHERGTDNKNFLIIELETTDTAKQDDIWKLEEMTKEENEYHYEYGLFLHFGIQNNAGILCDKKWFYRGEEIN